MIKELDTYYLVNTAGKVDTTQYIQFDHKETYVASTIQQC